jgi:hypothetical protein
MRTTQAASLRTSVAGQPTLRKCTEGVVVVVVVLVGDVGMVVVSGRRRLRSASY